MYRSGMTQSHAVDAQSEADARAARLHALSLALRLHEFKADLADDGQLLTVSSPGRPGHEVQVWCARRASDGGGMWFATQGKSIAAADDVTGALVAIKGMTAVRM